MDEKANSDTKNSSQLNEFQALQQIIAALSPLTEEARKRIFESAATFLRINSYLKHEPTQSISSFSPHPRDISVAAYSEDSSMNPKEFLLQKRPKTDVERIACLAYYLTNYRQTPHFKTVDLSMLNTEAAQPKFANTTYSSNNAIKMGYLAHATKGQRQLSAFGEQFVRALPDREAAKEAVIAFRRRPKHKKAKAVNGEIDLASESPES